QAGVPGEMNMRSWWMNTTATDAQLELREGAIPEPGPRQMLVRVKAAGVNRGEFIIGGLVKAGHAKPMGIEGAGEVVKCGAEATGARVIGTSGSQAKLDKLKPLGLDVAICTREPNFQPQVMDATGGAGVNLVVNNVGGTVFAEAVRSLAYQGRLATVGYVDG